MSLFGQAKKPAEGGGSLNDILSSPALRIELVTIIALCSDFMRREFLAVFQLPTAPVRADDIGDGDAGKFLIHSQNEDQLSQQGRRSVLEAATADINSAQTQALRRAAVTFFDKWQIDVLRRLGEVVSVRPDAIRKVRADAKARADAAAKDRRDRDYWNWANGVDSQISRGADPESPKSNNILPEGLKLQILRLPKDKRVLILDSVLLLMLSLESYTAHSRVMMLHVTGVLELPESTLIENESKVAEGLLASAAAKMSADESTERQASEDASARRWKVGLATVAGAALIGVTGGLAAPLLAAGVGSLMGGLGLGAVASLLGPLATNMVLVGGLFGAYGGRMTGSIMEKYAREIKDFKFLPLSTSTQAVPGTPSASTDDENAMKQLEDPGVRKSHKLRVTIGISGSITDEQDFTVPWQAFSGDRIETFGLRWEMEALENLGIKISEVVGGFAWDFAKYNLLSMVFAGLWPFGLLSAAKTLDSPFAIAKTRADKAGKVLADALIHKVQGARPVTLVGFGVGARVIYACLLSLADQNAFGLVDSVVLMGAPTPSHTASWRRIRAVVSGRVVNAFSDNDFMLAFLYRASSAQMGIAGVQPIKGVVGIENFDFTDMVKSHNEYRLLVGHILHRIGFADLDYEVVQQQRKKFEQAKDRGKKQGKEGRATSEQDQQQFLAKEDSKGNIYIVDKGGSHVVKGVAHPLATGDAPEEALKASRANAEDKEIEYEEIEDDGDEFHTIRMQDNDEPMSVLEPDPEPDYGPERETIHFGSDVHGFNLQWDSSNTKIS